MTTISAPDDNSGDTDTPPVGIVTFGALLDVLGFKPGEFVAVCHKVGQGKDALFLSEVCSPADAPALVTTLPTGADIWFGVNPTLGPARRSQGRGTADDVTRISSLYADLDISEGKCADFATAYAIIDQLSEIVHERPAVITQSGNGLQPYWRIPNFYDGESGERLLNGWKQLARKVAKDHGAKVDSVFSLDHIFRVPGTFNNKPSNVGGPKPVVCQRGGGDALNMINLTLAFDRHGIVPRSPRSSAPNGGTSARNGADWNASRSRHIVISSPDDWRFADATCPYMATVISGWADPEKVDVGTARHKWLLNQAIRLNCAHRYGCVTEKDHGNAVDNLVATFVHLISTREDIRDMKHNEVEDIFADATKRAAAKTDNEVREELGNHVHAQEWQKAALAQVIDFPKDTGRAEGSAGEKPEGSHSAGLFDSIRAEINEFWSSSDQLRDLRRFAQARLVGPWAMLGSTLARVIAHVPPSVVLPGIVGDYASLNLFVALVGRSGEAKSAAMKASAAWLKVEPNWSPSKPGSGEGLAKCFAYKSKLPAAVGGGWEQIGKQWSVLAQIPEIDTLTATAGRGGATIMSTLREGWSGERLGHDYAGEDKRIVLEEHRYRLCLVVGVQPLRAGHLFDDADAGTPQRFVWFTAIDDDMPDTEPDEPTGLDLGRWEPHPNANGKPLVDIDTDRNRQLADTADPADFEVLTVPDIAKHEIKTVQRAIRRGKADVDPLDGHRLLVALKIAAALMVLEGRRHTITESDWKRARLIMAVSDITRRAVLDEIEAERDTKNVSRARAEGKRKIVIDQVIDEEQQLVEAMAGRIVEKLKDKDGQSVSDLSRALSSKSTRDRFNNAVTYAVKQKMVRREDFIAHNKQAGVRLWLV